MITGLHITIYSSQERAEELRAFMRDTLKLSGFDAGGGWLIFDLPGEIGFHPDDDMGATDTPRPELSFSCSDIEKTVADLKKRGVKFVDEIEDAGWGKLIHFNLPGNLQAVLYEPRYRKPAAR